VVEIEGGTVTVLASGTLGSTDEEISVTATEHQWGFVALEISGNAYVTAIASRPTTASPIWQDQVETQSGLLWGGGSRDSLEVTLIDSGQNFWTYGQGGVQPYVPMGDGSYAWRGGTWKGADTATYTDRSASSIPNILVHNDGSFLPL
jgi:hypothetical protein